MKLSEHAAIAGRSPAAWYPAKPGAGAGGRWFFRVRVAVVLAFCVGIVAYVAISWRWPLIWDMQVLHYVTFLMDHGWAPYRQIGDMNMPGSYLFEGWALALFGKSDLGWRIYDFALSGVLIAAMIAIARRYDWLAGLIAGGTFVLAHGAEGPRNAGQRDQVMAVLLVVGYALCFESVRRRKAWMMVVFGLATAMAGSVKPTVAALGPLLLVLAALELRREGIAMGAYVLGALGGFAAAAGIVIGFLLMHHSMHAFLFEVTQVLPHYMTLAHPTWRHLIALTLQPSILFYTVCAVVVAVLLRHWRARWWNWEQGALLLGVFFGLLNYYGQRKGFFQHRYTLVAFVLLWASIQILLALRERGPARIIAVMALIVVVLYYIPRNIYWVHSWAPYDYYSAYLERDLQRMGTRNLQDQIQCLDVVDGCLNSLFHLQIVQNTGSTGDLLLFVPKDAPVVDHARAEFWNELQNNPPAVYVLSNWQFGEARNFNKIDAWPAFAEYLKKNYVMVTQREFHEGYQPTSNPGSNPDFPAYRIYIRRGSPLLSVAP